jgi:hypothetical protein
MTSPIVAPTVATALQQKAFDDANADYYSHVDWALDIQEALFEEADLRGIPANLIKRDKDTQFVIMREKALEGRWKEIDLSGTHWKTSIEMFLEEGTKDEVFIAPKRHPRFRSLLDGLWKLRDAGIIK